MALQMDLVRGLVAQMAAAAEKQMAVLELVELVERQMVVLVAQVVRRMVELEQLVELRMVVAALQKVAALHQTAGLEEHRRAVAQDRPSVA